MVLNEMRRYQNMRGKSGGGREGDYLRARCFFYYWRYMCIIYTQFNLNHDDENTVTVTGIL